MVNGISGYNNPNAAFYRAAAGNAVLHQNDVENMVKFLNGQPVTGTAEPTITQSVVGTIPFLGIFGGIQGATALKKNGWSLKNTINAEKITNPYTRGEWIKAGKDRVTKEYGNILKKTVAVNPERGFIGRMLDKIPGYTRLRATGFGQAMGKSGAGWMAVLDGATETFTQVVPTFSQLGAGAGFKQIAKSGTKVAAGAAGWLAGDALGKGIGAAVGTFICPGIGTTIGGFVGGFIGGIVGSCVAGKAAKAITGKNELEKAQEQQMSQVSQQIEADPETKLALAQQAYQQAEAILAKDPNNKDALAAKESAYKVITEYQNSEMNQTNNNPQTEQTTQVTTQQPTYNPYQPFNGIPSVPGFNGYGYDMNQYQDFMTRANSINFNKNQYNAQNPFAAKQTIQG